MGKKVYLTDSEQYLWNYIQKNISKIPDLSIVKLSEKVNVSTATVVRTMKKMGYDGYTAFRHSLINSNFNGLAFDNLNHADLIIKEAINKNQQEVLLTINNLKSTTIEDAIQKISAASRVLIFARGLSIYPAIEMALKLQLLDKHCETYDDPNIIRTRSKKLSKNDLVIFLSLTGDTEELVSACIACQKSETGTITFTTNAESTLAQLSEIVFIGHKAFETSFVDYEINSRLPLTIMSRIVMDAYSNRMDSLNNDNQDE